VIKPGIVANSTSGIRQALEGFMALKPALTIKAQKFVQAGMSRNIVLNGASRASIQPAPP
jgi:hypothetical protein